MNCRQLNIPRELLGFARYVLERDGIPYRGREDGMLFADLSGEEEEILIEDAMCEEQRERDNPEIPVYSWRTVCTSEKFCRLQKLNWEGIYSFDDDADGVRQIGGPFHPLEKDLPKFIDERDPKTYEEANAPIPGEKPGMSADELLKLLIESEKKN